jgi:predicted enzyme related to lactoylglutathione lyase
MTAESNALGSSLVIYAKDKARVQAFYQQALGLAAQHDEPGFSVLRGGAVELSIVRIPDEYAADIVITTPPKLREDTPLKASFQVGSLAQVRVAALATGGYLKPDAAAWRHGGNRVLDGWDPEGNVVQFTQAETGAEAAAGQPAG